jgi:hypothetical protein
MNIFHRSNNQKFLPGGPGGAVFTKSAPPGRRRQLSKKPANKLEAFYNQEDRQEYDSNKKS